MIKIQGTSKELQEISLVALTKDPYIFSKCMSVISENFYVDLSYKLIYKCLKLYYSKYMILPSKEELKLLVNDNYTDDYGDLDDISLNIDNIYSQKVSSEDYAYEKITDFIRRNKIEGALNKVIKHMESGSVDLDQVAVDLRDSIYINFRKAPVHNLADISSIREIREDALGTSDNPILIKFFIDKVNKCMQYGALPPGTLNMVTAPPGRGKTTLLINQGVCTAKQGYKILHMFLGDMSRYDGLLRYLSCFTGIQTKKLVNLNDDELAKFIQKYNMSGILANIDIASYAADELTANQLIEEVTSIQKDNRTHYNVVIVDYDENIANDEINIYKSGGQIYNKLALFAVVNKSVVFIASQPKPEFWKQEIIPLEAASESSKKQKIIDLMLTLGKSSKDSSVGTLNIAKNRRGDDCKIMRIKTDGSTAQMTHITEDEYNRIKQNEKSQRSSE